MAGNDVSVIVYSAPRGGSGPRRQAVGNVNFIVRTSNGSPLPPNGRAFVNWLQSASDTPLLQQYVRDVSLGGKVKSIVIEIAVNWATSDGWKVAQPGNRYTNSLLPPKITVGVDSLRNRIAFAAAPPEGSVWVTNAEAIGAEYGDMMRIKSIDTHIQ
jgi:hypothetical protein